MDGQNPTPYERRHLDPQEVFTVFAEALPQVELAQLQRWVQLQSAPDDPLLQRDYRVACEALARLEAERDRLLPPNEETE